MTFAREVVLVDYLRSPFSRSRPKDPDKDLLNSWRMDKLAGILVNEIIKRKNINPEEIDEFIVGTANPVLETYTGGGRLPLVLAKLPVSIAAQQIDTACGSSFNGVRTAAMSIASGYADIIFVVGVEHMTHVPMDGGGAIKPPTEIWTSPEYEYLDPPNILSMGLTAEKLLRKTDFTKEDMDQFAVGSHQKAAAAQKEGYFKGEIHPVEVTLPDGSKKIFDYDACVRPDTNMETLATLKPAYKEGGKITAGNSSPMNAGATCVLLMSRERAGQLGLKPMASFISFGVAGVEPSIMGEGPVPATKKAMKNAGMKIEDMDCFEINEAFSIVPMYAMQQLGIDPNKVNLKGGALAIGHPLGASGVRLIGTLARILEEKGGTYGSASMCCGMGQGVACILKRD
ncbi:MAG: acetyl-CoA C-acetyltransferase [Syntrophales bacterium]|nr:acetyl-CoA C-acetyltransferase [Syntrophales bacterium]MDY0043607.1 acetyl-CoA C-acetyltransferase [Syntrophales bacterium]